MTSTPRQVGVIGSGAVGQTLAARSGEILVLAVKGTAAEKALRRRRCGSPASGTSTAS